METNMNDTGAGGVDMGSAVGSGGYGVGGGSPSAALDYSGLLDSQGNFTREDWAGDNAGLSGKFKSLDGLVKSYQSLERMNSNGDKVPVPNENSGPDEWNAFYERLGRPSEPAGYEISIPEQLLETGHFGEGEFDAYKEKAHELGLSSKQASELANFYIEGVQAALEERREQEEQAGQALDEELAKEWGPVGGPRWKQHVALAQHGAKLLGLTSEDISGNSESLSPVFYKALVRAAQMSKDAGAAAALGGDGAGGADFGANIDAQIKRYLNDSNSPYWKREHPDHGATVAAVQRLYELKHAAA